MEIIKQFIKKLSERGIDIIGIDNIMQEVIKEYNNGWIMASERKPHVEKEVLVIAKRVYKDGTSDYIKTTAMYEDGTVSECDSNWYWEDIEGAWDEENECYIVPEGWWEYRHFNRDEVYNNEIDVEVVAWQEMPGDILD